MSDLSAVIVPKSDQINADDLIGGPRRVRIVSVRVSPGSEQPVSIAIEGDERVYRPCKSMARVMVAAWGPDSSKYAGRWLTLYRDPKVRWGGLEVGGIRIAEMSHIDKPLTIALTETRAQRKPFTVRPMSDAPAPTDAAAEWLGGYLAQVAAAVDLESLAEVQQQATKALARLATQRPDLHARAVDAGRTRFAELSEPDGAGEANENDLPSDDEVSA